jgi:hypothetical protein
MSGKIKATPPYKDTRGRWLTIALFADHDKSNPDLIEPPFTLIRDVEGKVNAHKTFIELGDPTGYEWATRYLHSFEHWEHLMKLSWFQEWYTRASRELHAKMRAAAIRSIEKISTEASSDAQRLAAAKYLAERPYEKADLDKKAAKRGRPSSAEKQGALNEAIRLDSETAAELERVGLKVLKGGKGG